MSTISKDQGPCVIVINASILQDMDDGQKAALMDTTIIEIDQADYDAFLEDLVNDKRILQVR